MKFRVGDPVEVCSNQDGFKGSYFLAKIVSENNDNSFNVEYKSLLSDDEKSRLIETMTPSEVRFVPPEIRVSGFRLNDKVDAFALDGWWAGRISGRNRDGKYFVYFERWGDEFEYPFSDLRVHMEFEGGRWMLSRNRDV